MAAVTLVRRKADELAAAALLHEALRVLNQCELPHWRTSNISEVPEMIRELARDRDDFKKMSIAYREQLAAAENEIRALAASRRKEGPL